MQSLEPIAIDLIIRCRKIMQIKLVKSDSDQIQTLRHKLICRQTQAIFTGVRAWDSCL